MSQNKEHFTCTHPAEHCPVTDARGVGVVGGSVMGRQAGQKQAPVRDSGGQMHHRYLEEQL